MSHQHAPSPDYTSHESVDWTVRHCTDCGDICLTASPEQGRCDTCEAAHRDELATAKRLLQQHARLVVTEGFRKPLDAHDAPIPQLVVNHEPWPTRSGGMNDPREILCEACGECALTYTGNADALDGTIGECESCAQAGVVDVDQDEGTTTVRFLRRCGECFEPGALDEQGICNECNEHAERREMGW